MYYNYSMVVRHMNLTDIFTGTYIITADGLLHLRALMWLSYDREVRKWHGVPPYHLLGVAAVLGRRTIAGTPHTSKGCRQAGGTGLEFITNFILICKVQSSKSEHTKKENSMLKNKFMTLISENLFLSSDLPSAGSHCFSSGWGSLGSRLDKVVHRLPLHTHDLPWAELQQSALLVW